MNIIDLGLLLDEFDELKAIANKYKIPTTIYANLLVEELLDDVDRLVSIEDDLLEDETVEKDDDSTELDQESYDEEFEYIEIELTDEQMQNLKTFSENTQLDLFIALRYIFLEAIDDEYDLSKNK